MTRKHRAVVRAFPQEKVCERCGVTFTRPDKRSDEQWERRRFCSPSCAQRTGRRAYVCECGAPMSKASKRCMTCAIRARSSLIEGSEHTCPQCGIRKPVSEFPKKGGRTRYAYCKTCHRAYQRLSKLAIIFGLTESDYDTLLAYQGGLCAICGRPPKNQRLAVDHEHETGLVRGLLCWSCNRTLGFWKESRERLSAAITYLDEPPAVRALGREVYGRKGRTDSKRPRRKKKTRRAADYLEAV